MAKYILSCRPGSYGNFSMAAYEHLPEIGVKYVEIPMPASMEEANMKIEIFEDVGLKALSLQFEIEIDDKKIIQKFKDSIPIIKKMNPMYIFSSCKVKKEKKRENGYPILKQIAEIALENDIFISIETHPFYNTNGDRGVETMKAIDSLGAKINFDTANIYYYNNGIDGKEELKKVLPWLGSLHLKDCMKNYHEWDFPAIGEGKCDYPGIKAILDPLDMIIPLTMEIEGTKGIKLNLEKSKDVVKRSVNYLNGLFSFE